VGMWSSRYQVVKTDELGHFRFEGLKAGGHSIWVSRKDGVRFNRDRLWSGSVKVKEGATALLDIAILTTTLKIEVLDEQGEVMPAVMLRLEGKQKSRNGLSGHAYYRSLTDATGVAEFENIATGSYRVSLYSETNRQGYALPETVLEVSNASRFKQETLRLVRAMKMSGTVQWDLSDLSQADRELIEGKPGSKRRKSREQSWMTFGDNSWTRVHERDGRFSFEIEGVRPGRLETRSWRRGLEWESNELLVNHDMMDVVLVMKPEANSLKSYLAAHRPKSAKKKNKKK